MNRALDVYVDDTLVGKLTDENNIWGFEYTPSWLASNIRHPLSPHIPLQEGKQIDGGTYRPVQWFFDNLLPEEKARELLAKNVKQHPGKAGEVRMVSEIFHNCIKETITNLKL